MPARQPSGILTGGHHRATTIQFHFLELRTDVRFASDYGLKSDIAPCPKSANKRHQFEMKEAAN
jgi:hypothetical protein